METLKNAQRRRTLRFAVNERLLEVNRVHCVSGDGRVWATKGRFILCYNGRTWEPVGRFPWQASQDLFGWSRPLARASRADHCNLFVNSHGHLLGIRGGFAYHVLSDRPPRRLFRIFGDCVLPRSICEDCQGWTYFGEYFRNSRRRTPVRVWRVSPDLTSHEVAYEFPAGSICHVHGIFRDPYDEKALWATVGDRTGECYILRSDDRFHTVERFGDGTQVWRAVTLFFTADHVCWLTDTPLVQNHACRADRRSGDLELGQPIACPTYFGTTTTDGLFVAFTAVEDGSFVLSDECTLLVSEDAFNWEEVHGFRKDRWWPRTVFGFGMITCPSGEMASDSLYLSGYGLVGFDGFSVRAAIEFR